MERNTTTPVTSTHVQDHTTSPDQPAVENPLIALTIVIVSVTIFVLLMVYVMILRRKYMADHSEIDHMGVRSETTVSPLRTNCKHTTDFAKTVSVDTCDIAPGVRDEWTADIELIGSLRSNYSQNLNVILSETPTTTERNDKTDKCVNLGTATNAVILDTIVTHIDENTEMKYDKSFLPTHHSITTEMWKDTKTEGCTTSLADENSKCSTSDTARELCVGPIQHDDHKENMILPVQVNEKFKEAIFDHNGGHLTLENYGISLFVPPGAIENGVSQAVSIELSYDKKHMPDLLNREAAISPVVICRPKGFIFKESVVLRYPHCGSGQHKIKHLTSDTDHTAPVYYRNSTSEDKKSIGLVMGGVCLRLIDHFTLYTTVSEGPVIKAFMIFADLQDKDVVILRIWIVNNTKDAVEEVISHESRKRGTELFGPKPYTIDNTAGDVQIEFKKMTDRWSLPDTVKISLKSTLTYVVNHEQIVIERIEGSSMHCDRVSMEVCIYQLHNANAELVNVAISEKVPQGSQASTAQISAKRYTCPSKPIPAALPYGLCQKICLLMDSKHPTGNDWRMLAEKIGLDMPAIQVLEENKAEKSPTGKLLSIWQSERSGIKMKYFRELRYLFVNIHRDDVATVISDFINIFEKNGLEAADEAIAPGTNSQKVLAYIEYNHTKKPIMQAEGGDQSKENITQPRCQAHRNDKLSDDDHESLEKSAQERREKSCRQLQSQDPFPEEKSALKSSKDTSNKENASGLCRNNDVKSEGSRLFKYDSGFYSDLNENAIFWV